MTDHHVLPPGIRACLFDLDGVISQTATVHAAAWKDMFDTFLRSEAARIGTEPVPFDLDRDYAEFVDGRPRLEGTRAFLASRGITLPEGGPDDAEDAPTVQGLARRKNALVLRHIEDDGVDLYESSVTFVRSARAAGLRTALVSSSANARQVLEVTGIEDLFDARIDGVVAQRDHLAGKPAPDTFLAGAEAVGVPADAAAVFEDALVGVEAGRSGGFGFVIGIDRTTVPPGTSASALTEHGRGLLEHGADVVVRDLADLVVPGH